MWRVPQHINGELLVLDTRKCVSETARQLMIESETICRFHSAGEVKDRQCAGRDGTPPNPSTIHVMVGSTSKKQMRARDMWRGQNSPSCDPLTGLVFLKMSHTGSHNNLLSRDRLQIGDFSQSSNKVSRLETKSCIVTVCDRCVLRVCSYSKNSELALYLFHKRTISLKHMGIPSMNMNSMRFCNKTLL